MIHYNIKHRLVTSIGVGFRKTHFILLSVLLLAFISPAQAGRAPTPGPGSLDPSFGTSGVVLADAGVANDIKVQTDGKILVLGGGYLQRFNPTGTLDTSFNGTGKVISNGSILLLQGNKILVSGTSGVAAYLGGAFTLSLFNSNGTPDLTFGSSGVVTTPVGNYGGVPLALTSQSDGKIIAAGYAITTYVPAPSSRESDVRDLDVALVRYNANGSLDTSFGRQGIVITASDPISIFVNEVANAVSVQNTGPNAGQIVIGGRTSRSISGYPDSLLIRYAANGTIDSSFGTNGFVFTDFEGFTDFTQALTILPNDKILAAGSTGATYDFAMVRYLPNGSLDSSFGSGGKVRTDFSLGWDTVRAMVIQPLDGKIILAGSADANIYDSRRGTWTYIPLDFALARYSADGILDTSFGTGGKVITAINSTGVDEALGVALQSDGKIVACGYTSSGIYTATDPRIAITRYLP